MNVLSSLLFCLAAVISGDSFSEAVFPLLQRLNEAVSVWQNDDREDSGYGGIICPGENIYHTRAAEAMFPFAFEYSVTGEERRAVQAMALAEWLMRCQQEDGSWKETPEEWTGTTADQLLMMLLTYPVLRERLDGHSDRRWRDSMTRAADYLTRVMDNRFASINYCATTAAALSEAYVILDDDSYARKARTLAGLVVSKMNMDSLIEGEGEREGAYKYGVDLGYNLEMSLWGLARYAELSGDEPVMNAVETSAVAHLPFIYPDGMLDASSGIRSNKWTVYGSGTSDGIHPLCAILSRRNPVFLTVALRNMGRIGDCFSSCGLLATGPDYDAVIDTPPCIYPSFAKAKSLAMALAWMPKDVVVPDKMPADDDFEVFLQSVGTAVMRRGAFCSTVTAYNYKARAGAGSKYMHRPSGGAMSALWVEGFGLLGASSQTEYHRWEPMSFPIMPEGLSPLTPRLEQVDGDRTYTNLYEFDATMTFSSGENVNCSITGELKDRNQFRSGAAYRIDYTVSAECLVKHYEVRRRTSSGEIVLVEPVVYDEGVQVEQLSPGCVLLTRGDCSLRISVGDGAAITPDWAGLESHRQVYPALRALPLVVRFDGAVDLKIEKTR